MYTILLISGKKSITRRWPTDVSTVDEYRSGYLLNGEITILERTELDRFDKQWKPWRELIVSVRSDFN